MTRYIKWGIWAYLLLLIFEGALRKWVLPGAADVLLLIRDPLVLLIYLMAAANGTFPRNNFIAYTFALGIGATVWSFLAGQNNIWVTVVGLRTDFLHVPFIWVMAETLDRRDLRRMGYTILAIAIPMTVLMIMQNRAGTDAWVNRGSGGGEGGQIHGAMGRIRPPGLFSFITGPMVFFPLATAFLLAYAIEKKSLFATWFVYIAGIFIALALPISISRGVMIISGCVAAVFLVCIVIKGAFNASFVRALAGTVLVLLVLRFLPITSEAWTVFMSRWDTASAEVDGDAWGSLTTRVATGFTSPFELMLDTPFFGRGVGVGTNMGSKLLTGSVGFLLSENEWELIIQELGPLLGLGFIGLRVALQLHILLRSWQALRQRGQLLPMLVTVASIPPLLLQQWGQATQLGFAIFDAGLVLALIADRPSEDEDDDETEEDDEDDSPDEEDGDEHPPTDTEDDDPSETSEEPSEHEKRRRKMRGLA